MSDYLLALVLGVVEGLTEFLPVSSTAHLRIVQAALGIDLSDPYWKMFSIVIQLGAILCLPVYFGPRLVGLLRGFPRGARGDRTALDHPLTLTGIAFVVTAIPAFLLGKVIGQHLESLRVMALSLLVGGVVMWVADARFERTQRGAPGDGRRTDTVDGMSLAQAVWIGACQVLAAVFPGTSRSMATITAGMLAGMTRPAALEFSFFLSIPTMAAAGQAIFDNLGLLFAIGVAVGLARENHGAAGLAAVVGYVVATEGAKILIELPYDEIVRILRRFSVGELAGGSAEFQGMALQAAKNKILANLSVPVGLLSGCDHVALLLNGAAINTSGRNFGAYNGYGHDA